MKLLLEEIRATVDAGIHSTALISALSVPDACGKIEYPDQGNGERYKNWYKEFVEGRRVRASGLSGEIVWAMRNQILHENVSSLKKFGYDHVIFTGAGLSPITMHDIVMMEFDNKSALCLSFDIVIDEIIDGALAWIEACENDPRKKIAISNFLDQRGDGLGNFIKGMSIMC